MACQTKFRGSFWKSVPIRDFQIFAGHPIFREHFVIHAGTLFQPVFLLADLHQIGIDILFIGFHLDDRNFVADRSDRHIVAFQFRLRVNVLGSPAIHPTDDLLRFLCRLPFLDSRLFLAVRHRSAPPSSVPPGCVVPDHNRGVVALLPADDPDHQPQDDQNDHDDSDDGKGFFQEIKKTVL